MFSKNCWINNSDEFELNRVLEGLLVCSGFTILGVIDYTFSPQGYTKIWLLGESHFALHTFPEESKTYIELSSCSRQKFIAFWNNIGLRSLDISIVSG